MKSCHPGGQSGVVVLHGKCMGVFERNRITNNARANVGLKGQVLSLSYSLSLFLSLPSPPSFHAQPIQHISMLIFHWLSPLALSRINQFTSRPIYQLYAILSLINHSSFSQSSISNVSHNERTLCRGEIRNSVTRCVKGKLMK